MARTRIRSIVVDGIDYRWAVGMVDPAHVRVSVWRDAPEPMPGEVSPARASARGGALEVVVAFDDPWLNYGPIITAPAGRAAEVFELEPIAPALIARIVRQALETGWQPHRTGTTRLRLTSDREHLTPPS